MRGKDQMKQRGRGEEGTQSEEEWTGWPERMRVCNREHVEMRGTEERSPSRWAFKELRRERSHGDNEAQITDR